MNKETKIKPVWQADSAELFGDIELSEGVSIWPKVVMRAEVHYIKIGSFTNIQDFAMIHISSQETVIGEFCSITHHSTIHGATIGDNCLIGINATVMDRAIVGSNSIVAGNTIVTEDSVFPDNSVIAGVPGRIIATKNNYVANRINAMAYYENAIAYSENNYRRWAEEDYQSKIDSWKNQFELELTSREPDP